MFFIRTAYRLLAVASAAFVGVSAADTNVADSASAETVAAAAPQLTDGEVWNQGVEYWRAGDMTNALSTLRPLMLSRTHGARASEIVGAIQHARMRQTAAQDPATAAAAAEDAASAMQIALRSSPDDPRARRNFTRAVDRVAELREEAHVREVLAASQGKGPDRQLGEAVKEARAMMSAAAGVLTNDAPRALSLSEAMSRQAERLADVWIPLKEGMVQAMAQNATNRQQLAYAINEIEAAREATKKAAVSLADLDPAAQTQLAQSEDALTRFWKMAVMPPDAIDEGIQAQTNAFIDAVRINGRAWSPEALDFTKAFRARFPMWAQQYEQQAQADTNKPPFTKEAQAEIEALAGEVEKMQMANVKAEDPPSMLDALAKLERIRELLPKDKNGGGQDNRQQNQDDRKEQDKNKDENKDEDGGGQPPEAPPPEDDGKDDEKKEQEAKEGEDEKPDDREVDAVLMKAQERNDEHEAEKLRRMRKAPLPPNERDW